MSDARPAYFVIADISGYTKFMAETEITHAKDILESLFGALIPEIRPPLAISGLQGDAVFAYAFDGDVVGGQFLLDLVDQIYVAFARERDRIDINTDCRCGACANVSGLELKVIIHHGDCVVQQTGGRAELAGREVITAFRLLKNEVTSRTGLNAYALITCDAVRAMGQEDVFEGEPRYSEEIEHIGPVEYLVHDLRRAWHVAQETPHQFVAAEDDLLMAPWRYDLPIPPSAAFTLWTRPDMRAQMLHADKVTLSGTKKGKVAPGTVYHCHHGKNTYHYQIVDWQPGRYATMEYLLPLGLRVYETAEMQETPTGTTLYMRIGRVRSPSVLGRLARAPVEAFLRRVFRPEEEIRRDILARICTEWIAENAELAAPKPAPDPAALGVSDMLSARLSA